MLQTSTIRCHWLRYPLMWVMLLWALTLPGHELLVYDYMVQGSVQESVQRLRPAASPGEEQTVKPQSVQVFPDASMAPVLVIKQVALFSRLVLLPLLATLLLRSLPAYTSPVSVAERLQQVLTASTLPNAP